MKWLTPVGNIGGRIALTAGTDAIRERIPAPRVRASPGDGRCRLVLDRAASRPTTGSNSACSSTSPEQETYELLRPIVLFGQPTGDRARETGVPERTLRRKVARFDAIGMRSLFDRDRRRRSRIAGGCRSGSGAPSSTEGGVPAVRPARDRAHLPAPLRPPGQLPHRAAGAGQPSRCPSPPPRRFPRYHDDPRSRCSAGKAVVTLYLEGWSAKAIAGYLETSRAPVYETLRRWDDGGLARAGRPLAGAAPAGAQGRSEGDGGDPPPAGQSRARRVPRSTPRLAQLGHRPAARAPAAASWRCTGRSARPRPCGSAARAAADAVRRRSAGTSTGRSISATSRITGSATGKPVYVISILENFSRALLASVDLPAPGPDRLPDRAARGGRSARRAGGASSATAAASSKRSRPRRSTRALGIRKEQIEQGQPWQNYIETNFNVMRRMADYHYAQATTWAELQAVHDRFFIDYNHQPHCRPRRPARRAPQSRRRCWAGCMAPGATRPTSTGCSGCGPRACSTPTAPCASGIGGSTGNAGSPASGPPSGWQERR